MKINKITDKSLRDFAYELIQSSEAGFIATIFSSDDHKYLRNNKTIELYYLSNVKQLVDTGHPVYSDCIGPEILGKFVSELTDEEIDVLHKDPIEYTESKIMYKVINEITEIEFKRDINSISAYELYISNNSNNLS